MSETKRNDPMTFSGAVPKKAEADSASSTTNKGPKPEPVENPTEENVGSTFAFTFGDQAIPFPRPEERIDRNAMYAAFESQGFYYTINGVPQTVRPPSIFDDPMFAAMFEAAQTEKHSGEEEDADLADVEELYRADDGKICSVAM